MFIPIIYRTKTANKQLLQALQLGLYPEDEALKAHTRFTEEKKKYGQRIKISLTVSGCVLAIMLLGGRMLPNSSPLWGLLAALFLGSLYVVCSAHDMWGIYRVYLKGFAQGYPHLVPQEEKIRS